MSLKIQDKK